MVGPTHAWVVAVARANAQRRIADSVRKYFFEVRGVGCPKLGRKRRATHPSTIGTVAAVPVVAHSAAESADASASCFVDDVGET